MASDSKPLAGPLAKLDRAREHLESLDAGCEAFLEGDPYYVAVEFDSDAGCHFLRFRVREQVPLRLSVIVGDIVHNLRSALDQATWLLAGQTKSFAELNKPGVRERISFPITRSRPEFEAHKVIPFLQPAPLSTVAVMQPYELDRPVQHHPLILLNELWNTDKHRTVHGGFAAVDLAPISFQPAAVHIEAFEDLQTEWLHPPGEGMEDGTNIARVRFGGAAAPPAAKVDVKGKPTAQMMFGSGQIAFYPRTLDLMAGFVDTILAALAVHLDP
ncbi:MAG: hypothetical protein H0V29_08325 [Thermoleophilaceae bacterium]|nr:hypothetical protein [Thermoleophilaceae bacterium]